MVKPSVGISVLMNVAAENAPHQHSLPLNFSTFSLPTGAKC